jgi:hypothetical protein
VTNRVIIVREKAEKYFSADKNAPYWLAGCSGARLHPSMAAASAELLSAKRLLAFF